MKLKDIRVAKIDPNYKEIRKLDALLTEAGIPHTFQTFYWNKKGDLRGAQIIYPEDGPNRVADVIIHGASYGNEFDLLEMMGLVPETAEPDELTTGNIEGYMTAERCFRRIRYHWDTHGGKEADRQCLAAKWREYSDRKRPAPNFQRWPARTIPLPDERPDGNAKICADG